MNVIIAGGGSVGRFIAEQLASSGHSITILDNDQGVVSRHGAAIDGVTWVQGDACDIELLGRAGLATADVVAAVEGFPGPVIGAINGFAITGGFELALACDEILLVDDRSSAVSLPEVPLLGVLPGTGGLTRVTDKRHVRRDLADIFCTTVEGVRGRDLR